MLHMIAILVVARKIGLTMCCSCSVSPKSVWKWSVSQLCCLQW